MNTARSRRSQKLHDQAIRNGWEQPAPAPEDDPLPDTFHIVRRWVKGLPVPEPEAQWTWDGKRWQRCHTYAGEDFLILNGKGYTRRATAQKIANRLPIVRGMLITVELRSRCNLPV